MSLAKPIDLVSLVSNLYLFQEIKLFYNCLQFDVNNCPDLWCQKVIRMEFTSYVMTTFI